MQKPATDVLLGVSVYNEEAEVYNWLDYWSLLVDDIVVVNQSSTDNTAGEVLRFIAEHERGKSVQMFKVPTLGKCEPVYIPLQVIAANSQKWLLKMDIDEFIDEEVFYTMMDMARKNKVKHQTTTYLIARKNLVDGVDISKMFANPNDPKGRDWQIRLSFGPVLSYGFGSHTHPNINGRWAMMDPDKVCIRHERIWTNLLRSNLTREKYLTPQARQMQRVFIQKVAEALGKDSEEVVREAQQYV